MDNKQPDKERIKKLYLDTFRFGHLLKMDLNLEKKNQRTMINEIQIIKGNIGNFEKCLMYLILTKGILLVRIIVSALHLPWMYRVSLMRVSWI